MTFFTVTVVTTVINMVALSLTASLQFDVIAVTKQC
jgi:hypothetical protein